MGRIKKYALIFFLSLITILEMFFVIKPLRKWINNKWNEIGND